MENVPDFIILRHLYDESVARRYQPGTRIEIILDNHWWTGTIDKKEVHDEENYPRFVVLRLDYNFWLNFDSHFNKTS